MNNRLKKKVRAKEHNARYVPFSLDPKKHRWDRKCRKCYGRGYVSLDEKKGKVFLCTCCEILKEEVPPKEEPTGLLNPEPLLTEDITK